MKRLLIAVLVVLTAASALPVAAGEHPRCERKEAKRDHRGDPCSERRTERGAVDCGALRGDRVHRGRGGAADRPRADLPAPPRGQHWISDKERYLLVSDGNGVIRHAMARALR